MKINHCTWIKNACEICLEKNNHFTDITVMTVAAADAIMSAYPRANKEGYYYWIVDNGNDDDTMSNRTLYKHGGITNCTA